MIINSKTVEDLSIIVGDKAIMQFKMDGDFHFIAVDENIQSEEIIEKITNYINNL